MGDESECADIRELAKRLQAFSSEAAMEPEGMENPGTMPEPEGGLDPSAHREPLSRLLIRHGDRAVLLPAESIVWLEADDDFVRLHLADRSYRIRSTLSGLHDRLDQRRFLRIHRSAIVNADFITELRTQPSGEYNVLLKDGTVLRLSRSFRNALKELGGIFGADEGR